jgi:hypothetical protein
MKRKISLIVLLFSLFFTVNAFAEVIIKAEVDKPKLTTDEDLTYKITITSSEKNLPAPQMPKFKGFNIISTAQSSTMSFVKNSIKTVLVYAIILTPTATGKFKIEPSQIKVKGKVYSSSAFEIEVSPGKAAPEVQPEEKSSPQEENQPETENPKVTL